MQARGPALIVTSHAYLTQNMESLREQENIDMVITDESWFQTSVSNGRPVNLTDLCRNRNLPGTHTRYANEEHSRTEDVRDIARGAEIVEYALNKARERKNAKISRSDYLLETLPVDQILIEDVLEGFERVCNPFGEFANSDSDVDDVFSVRCRPKWISTRN